MLRGINHITFAVQDLTRSVKFYRDIVGCELRATWDSGAYLTIDGDWICLSLDPEASQSNDYSHVAFSVDAESLSSFRKLLIEHGVNTWKDNTSEGESVYFVDPDGHRLEAHVGDLESRLLEMQENPYTGQRIGSGSL